MWSEKSAGDPTFAHACAHARNAAEIENFSRFCKCPITCIMARSITCHDTGTKLGYSMPPPIGELAQVVMELGQIANLNRPARRHACYRVHIAFAGANKVRLYRKLFINTSCRIKP